MTHGRRAFAPFTHRDTGSLGLAERMVDKRFRCQRGSVFAGGLGNAFPQRIITSPIPFVNSISDLLSSSLLSPSTSVRHAARRAFETMSDYHDAHCLAENRAALEAISA
jgi:hypothetical protein